jgi:hypothetical protein
MCDGDIRVSTICHADLRGGAVPVSVRNPKDFVPAGCVAAAWRPAFEAKRRAPALGSACMDWRARGIEAVVDVLPVHGSGGTFVAF